MKVRDADTYLIRGAAVAADSPPQKYFTDKYGTVEMKLGAGDQKIRVSADGYKLYETMLRGVKPGGGSYTVDLK